MGEEPRVELFVPTSVLQELERCGWPDGLGTSNALWRSSDQHEGHL